VMLVSNVVGLSMLTSNRLKSKYPSFTRYSQSRVCTPPGQKTNLDYFLSRRRSGCASDAGVIAADSQRLWRRRAWVVGLNWTVTCPGLALWQLKVPLPTVTANGEARLPIVPEEVPCPCFDLELFCSRSN